jgi:hypothetical protein
MKTYQSNYEGDIVQYIYDNAAAADAYLINPAALTRRGAPCALALVDSHRPYIELHFANIAALGWSNGALITRRASGVVMGLRHYSYVGAVFGLVGALDAGGVARVLTLSGEAPLCALYVGAAVGVFRNAPQRHRFFQSPRPPHNSWRRCPEGFPPESRAHPEHVRSRATDRSLYGTQGAAAKPRRRPFDLALPSQPAYSRTASAPRERLVLPDRIELSTSPLPMEWVGLENNALKQSLSSFLKRLVCQLFDWGFAKQLRQCDQLRGFRAQAIRCAVRPKPSLHVWLVLE